MKRILVVHTGGGLGDVLLSTPVLQALHHAWPEAELDFICARSTAPALRGNPHLRELIVFEGRKAPRLPGEALRWAQKLKQRSYDAALVLWSATGWAWTLWLAGIPIRVGQGSRLAYSFLYTHRVRVRSEHGDTHSHWTDILLDYVRALGLDPPTPEVTYVLPPDAEQTAASLIPPGEGPLIGFHTGKGIPLEPGRWPVAAFATWARALEEELGARLVFTGGPGEVDLVAEVVRLADSQGLNLAGSTDLPTLAAVARQCQVFVCPDSGPMHLAAAVGTPVVGIYALEEDFPQRWAPFGTRHRIVRPAVRNCHPGCLKSTCPDFRCYWQVEAKEIVNCVLVLLTPSPEVS